MHDLVYFVGPHDRNVEGLRRLLTAHPEIAFVSLAAVDLGGNDTDEKIPASHFLEHVEEYLEGGVQTDGSSVVLPGIATLNDGKVDLVADSSVNWFVDYNYEFCGLGGDKPVGTLRIPSFLKHRELLVDSRSVLKRTMESLQRRIPALFREYSGLSGMMGVDPEQIQGVRLLAATELEFWVRTPGARIETEKLSVSQILQESYWKRTKGPVRSALEHALMLLDKYGLSPEMGHKEVGGVKATLGGQGRFGDIMEQLEIDWKYSTALQTADNELLARIVIKEVFRRYGLEVTFLAKPVDGVAGSGEHTHVSVALEMKDGSSLNLFTPADPSRDFLSPLGWGALMGLLRNYEVVGSFVTATNDGFRRLKPGFEAPVCIVASIGHDISVPSRNRTVLVGLIRDLFNPHATRFEVRSPSPHTITNLALAAFFQSMMDGMQFAASSGADASLLEKEFCKDPGVEHPYLEKERAYRSEADVFEEYPAEERARLFGVPPATVWEALQNLEKYPEKTAVLSCDGVFTPAIINAYQEAARLHWVTELSDRIIPDNADFVRSCTRLHENDNGLDGRRWAEIQSLRNRLLRDEIDSESVFTSTQKAIGRGDYQRTSELQIEMADLMSQLKRAYREYRRNILP
jgi:glutamine synthetase